MVSIVGAVPRPHYCAFLFTFLTLARGLLQRHCSISSRCQATLFSPVTGSGLLCADFRMLYRESYRFPDDPSAVISSGPARRT
jgi:hypothetical protein